MANDKYVEFVEGDEWQTISKDIKKQIADNTAKLIAIAKGKVDKDKDDVLEIKILGERIKMLEIFLDLPVQLLGDSKK